MHLGGKRANLARGARRRRSSAQTVSLETNRGSREVDLEGYVLRLEGVAPLPVSGRRDRRSRITESRSSLRGAARLFELADPSSRSRILGQKKSNFSLAIRFFFPIGSMAVPRIEKRIGLVNLYWRYSLMRTRVSIPWSTAFVRSVVRNRSPSRRPVADDGRREGEGKGQAPRPRRNRADEELGGRPGSRDHVGGDRRRALRGDRARRARRPASVERRRAPGRSRAQFLREYSTAFGISDADAELAARA